MPKKKDSQKKEKVIEYFEVNDKGKNKIIKSEGTEIINDKPNKKQIGKENKVLIGILITIGIVFIIFATVLFLMNLKSHLNYRGVGFDVFKEGNLIFYKTSFPVILQGKNYSYDIYLYNNPYNLENISFNGSINFKGDMVLNFSNSLNCGGQGVLAVAEFVKLNVLNMNIFKNQSLGCDPLGQYMFVNVIPSNVSSIDQVGPACYNLNVNNCAVLPVMEKFMVESFVKADNIIYNKSPSS